MNGRPKVYILIILPCLLGCFWLFLAAGLQALVSVRGYVGFSEVPDTNAALVCIPMLFIAIPVSLILGNFILHSVPALRSIAVEYTKRCGRPSYKESQTKLLKLLLLICLIGAPFVIAGFLI